MMKSLRRSCEGSLKKPNSGSLDAVPVGMLGIRIGAVPETPKLTAHMTGSAWNWFAHWVEQK